MQCSIRSAARKVACGSKFSVVRGNTGLKTEWLILIARIFGQLLERMGQQRRIALKKSKVRQGEVEKRALFISRFGFLDYGFRFVELVQDHVAEGEVGIADS